jgi:hypothetical protein
MDLEKFLFITFNQLANVSRFYPEDKQNICQFSRGEPMGTCCFVRQKKASYSIKIRRRAQLHGQIEKDDESGYTLKMH